MAAALSPEVHLMRRRVRHVHIPDLPPSYAPRSFPGSIRDHIQGQIVRQRAVRDESPEDNATYGPAKLTSGVQTSFTSWVKRAGPPPTVLSFTRRPTYILPRHLTEKQEPWQVEYLTKALRSRINLHFPEPPGWSSQPWRPFWEREMAESEWKNDPLNHQWPEVGVLIMPCAEPMFLGPGQVSIWPIIDLKDEIQRGSSEIRTKYEYARILEDTTIELLKREFGIHAFAIPGFDGVWVESRIPPPEVGEEQFEGIDTSGEPDILPASNRRANVRRIATIHASITDKITQWGVSIHVGQPDPTLDSWASPSNPWTPIRQQKTTTSIAAELSYTSSSVSPLGPSKYLFTYFNQDAMPARAGQGAIPYSLIKTGSGRRHTAPLGMDNRDISTAWTYEFARQLGMKDGHVDHYGMVEADNRYATEIPTKTSGVGFRFRGVFSEDVMNSSYRQVDVPHILVSKHEKASPGIVEDSIRIERNDGRIDADGWHDGWLLSWPLWKSTLLRKLDEAICGGPADTRVRTYEVQKQASSRLQRRRNELRRVREVEEGWRAEMPHLVRRPLTDGIVRELARRLCEMEAVLKTVRVGARGAKSAQLLDSTIQMRRLIERRFAGAFGRGAGTAEPEWGDVAAEKSDPLPEKSDPLPEESNPLPEKGNPLPEQIDPFSVMEAVSGATKTARSTASPKRKEKPTPRRLNNPGAPSARELKWKGRIKVLQERVKDRVTLRPYELVPLTKTKAERERERAEAREKRRTEYIEMSRETGVAGVAGVAEVGEKQHLGPTEEREQAAEKPGEAASRPWGMRSILKDAGEGAGAAKPSGTSQFLPTTHQIGES